MSTISTTPYLLGAMDTNQSTMPLVNMLEMRMAMVSMRYMSIRWKVSGHCFAPGCVHIVEFRRKSCRGT